MLCQSMHDVYLHHPYPQVSWWSIQLLWTSGMDRTRSARLLVPTNLPLRCHLVRHQGTQLNGSTQQMPCCSTVCSRLLRYNRDWPMFHMGFDHNFFWGSSHLRWGSVLPEILSQRHQSQRNPDVHLIRRLHFDRTMPMLCNSSKLTYHHRNCRLKSWNCPTSKLTTCTSKLTTC